MLRQCWCGSVNHLITKSIITQQELDIDPLMGQCWATFADGEPALNQ